MRDKVESKKCGYYEDQPILLSHELTTNVAILVIACPFMPIDFPSMNQLSRVWGCFQRA